MVATSISSIKKRDSSIDALKGLLIVFLVVHHTSDLGHIALEKGSLALQIIELVQRPLFLCYFMQLFFVITGMYSNYEKNVKEFIFNQVRLLLIPLVVFSLLFGLVLEQNELKTTFLQVLKGGNFWFLCAMFWGKIIYYTLNKCVQNKTILVGILTLLCFCGSLLNYLDVIPNYYWHRQILDLTLFIAIGNVFKTRLVDTKLAVVCFGIYALTNVVCFAIYGTQIPYVTAGFGTSPDAWIFHLILAVCGSIVMLSVCKFMKKQKIFEYIGKQSLVVYVFHIFFLKIMFKGFAPLLNCAENAKSFLYIAIVIVSTVGNCLLVAYIIDNTKLKILFGRS